MLTLNRSLRAGAAALSLSLLASTSAFAGGTTTPSQDIVDTAVAAGSFQTLTTALKAAGLVETLKGKGHSPFLPPPMRPLPSCRKERCSRF